MRSHGYYNVRSTHYHVGTTMLTAAMRETRMEEKRERNRADAAKARAAKFGMTPEQLAEREAHGEKGCIGCTQFFPADTSHFPLRAGSLGPHCHTCRAGVIDKMKQGQKRNAEARSY